MNTIGKRILELRKKAALSQSQLANKVGVSLVQLQRYENKGVQPPADILKNLADIFNVSIDFLVYGNNEEKAQQAIHDNDLLAQFKAVEQLNDHDRNTIKDIIDAFIMRSKVQAIVAL
jgi:transcriptional regulator with XRE-family HTH domain